MINNEKIVNGKCAKCGNSEYSFGKPYCTDEFCDRSAFSREMAKYSDSTVMENKQTAVDWLAERYNLRASSPGIKQAKQMEKDRLFHSFYAGAGVEDNEEYYEAFEQYYNETYGNQ